MSTIAPRVSIYDVTQCNYGNHHVIPYTMKVLRQKIMWQIVHVDLYQDNFHRTLKLSLKSIFEQCHLELSYKKVLWTCKNRETFLPQNFHVIWYSFIV